MPFEEQEPSQLLAELDGSGSESGVVLLAAATGPQPGRSANRVAKNVSRLPQDLFQGPVPYCKAAI
jgi:hypothetical protein